MAEHLPPARAHRGCGASLARDRAEQARKASIFARGGPRRPTQGLIGLLIADWALDEQEVGRLTSAVTERGFSALVVRLAGGGRNPSLITAISSAIFAFERKRNSASGTTRRDTTMQVFVTGASGHIASAVIPELLSAGHEVVGLARSDVSAAAVQALGAEVHRGGLDDLDTLRDAAAASDGVIHLAFKHEQVASGDFGAAMEAHMDAIEALGGALAGTGKPMVATSATMMLVFSGVLGQRLSPTLSPSVRGPRRRRQCSPSPNAASGRRSCAFRPPCTARSTTVGTFRP